MNTQSNPFKRTRTKSLAILLGLIAVGLAIGSTAVAQSREPDTDAVSRLSLQDCVGKAIERSPILQAAAQNRIAARETVGEARGAYYPTLGVRGGVSRWQNHAFLPKGLSVPNLSTTVGPTDDWSAGGFARYLLYDGGARQAGLEAARASASLSIHEQDAMREAVVFGVHQAFCQLAVALELHAVAVKSLSATEAHLAAARQRQTAGAVTASDVLRAQVEVDNARMELVTTESLIHVARGDLNAAMGAPPETPVAIETGAVALVFREEPDVTNLLGNAMRDRPEILAAQDAVAAARQQVRAAQSAYGPRILADGSYGWRDDSASLQDEAWFAGISVELTAFEGFAVKHKLGRARADLAGAECGLRQAQVQVRRELWTAFAQRREALQLMQATSTQVQNAQESERLMAARYKAGSASITDLLDTQTALTDAEARQAQARWNSALSSAALLRAAGSLTPPANGKETAGETK